MFPYRRFPALEVLLDPIEIPDESRRVKECEYPDEREVAAIWAFIKRTGAPHLYPNHTHTKPPKGSLPVYVEEFTLPKEFRSLERRAPCPCCTDRFPKYWKNGKIAYFPDERVLRLMGPECFATLDAGGHHAALNQLRALRKKRNDIRYLNQNVHLLPILAYTLGEWMPILSSIDEARRALRDRLTLLKLPLWSKVRDGVLHVTRARRENFRKSDGTSGERTVHDLQVYGPLNGFMFFSPSAKPLAKRLEILQHRLNNRGRVPTQLEIETMDAKYRHEYAILLQQAITRMRDVLAEATDVRRALSREAMATLNGWSRDPGADFPIHIDADQDAIYIGRSDHNRLRIPVDFWFWKALKPLPELAQTQLAAE
jgi:hypothetical protein